jgi:hypothetical protein
VPRVLVQDVTPNRFLRHHARPFGDGAMLLITVAGHWSESFRLLGKVEKMMFVDDDEMKDKVGFLRAPVWQTDC